MKIIETKKDWAIIMIEDFYMIQHIDSKEYLGGTGILTASKNINSKKNWKLDNLETAQKRLSFLAREMEGL